MQQTPQQTKKQKAAQTAALQQQLAALLLQLSTAEKAQTRAIGTAAANDYARGLVSSAQLQHDTAATDRQKDAIVSAYKAAAATLQLDMQIESYAARIAYASAIVADRQLQTAADALLIAAYDADESSYRR
jgi:hypothetical protein